MIGPSLSTKARLEIAIRGGNPRGVEQGLKDYSAEYNANREKMRLIVARTIFSNGCRDVANLIEEYAVECKFFTKPDFVALAFNVLKAGPARDEICTMFIMKRVVEARFDEIATQEERLAAFVDLTINLTSEVPHLLEKPGPGWVPMSSDVGLVINDLITRKLATERREMTRWIAIAQAKAKVADNSFFAVENARERKSLFDVVKNEKPKERKGLFE